MVQTFDDARTKNLITNKHCTGKFIPCLAFNLLTCTDLEISLARQRSLYRRATKSVTSHLAQE
jgi:hypothetical protein